MKKLFLETSTSVIELPAAQIDSLLKHAKGNVLPPILTDDRMIARYRHNDHIVNLHLSQYMHYGQYHLEYMSEGLNDGVLHEDTQLEKITTHLIPVELSGIPVDTVLKYQKHDARTASLNTLTNQAWLLYRRVSNIKQVPGLSTYQTKRLCRLIDKAHSRYHRRLNKEHSFEWH